MPRSPAKPSKSKGCANLRTPCRNRGKVLLERELVRITKTGRITRSKAPKVEAQMYPPLVPITPRNEYAPAQNSRMTTIKLRGRLGRRYGTEHQLSVSNVGEAIRALDSD